ncbi:iron(III) transport system ATP-binding protein/D-methionine transport system ATP-binding protein [Allochromatium warmingii]|uniref:Iron(III) transport system ATP-binding protein/D-methionine transport system ATP-binding protein n=1 Tax=Allochromatium warmingii TaxID=61595 RepID=A0A1H3FS46_ALLWA|nr:ATP-binding cassette domain-containing protein [Allochromatium warmingii]SDX93750.1 iron(III) transport system ATP-binding protein/D-methionine transport system ATP-binding protein [Allochromatium warmingii]
MLLELSAIHQHVNARHALADLTLTLPEAGWLVICGQNGAGKTLLMRILAGLDPPSAGQIRLLGQTFERFPAATLRTWRHQLGVVLQGDSLLADLTVLENLWLPLRDEPQARADLERAARLMIALFQLEGLEQHHPHELSLGQRRQVALARALVRKPALLLWDGLADGLDPATLADCLRKLRAMRSRHGQPLALIATSNSAALPVVGDYQVIALDRGRPLFSGSFTDLPAALAQRPELSAVVGMPAGAAM